MDQLKTMTARVWAAFIASVLVGVSTPAAAQDYAQLDAELKTSLVATRVAGISWSIVDGDRVTIRAQGVRDRSTRAPMRPDDKVHVGSVAKTMIALGVLQLVSNGQLALDTPVERILPEIRFDNPWRASHPVTVRHLLDHTSGLEDARIWQIFSARAKPDQPLRDAFTRDPGVLRLHTRPGETFSYSNMGYALAAMVIEKIAGERYEARMDRTLLRPLGMADSTFRFTSQAGPWLDSRLAWGHLGDGSLAQAIPAAVRPAAQFTTTPADMAKLAKFLMGDGTVAGTRLIDSALLQQMGQPHGTLAAKAGLTTGYGLGLARRDREGSVGLCHQGDTVGYHALFCIYPDQRKAFFLALNNDGDGIDLARFHRALLQATAPAKAAPAAPSQQLVDAAALVGYYAPLTSRFAIERYPNLLDGGARVELTGKGLQLVRSGRDPVPLAPLGGGLLRAADRSQASHVVVNHDGMRILSDGTRSWRKASPVMHYLLWAGLGLGLAGLAWFLVATPVLAWRRHRRLFEPAFLALVAIVPVGWLVYRMPFTQWGDPELPALLLALVTLSLPAAVALQAWRSWQARKSLWQADAAAAAMALQWLAVLAWFGLIPLRLWS